MVEQIKYKILKPLCSIKNKPASKNKGNIRSNHNVINPRTPYVLMVNLGKFMTITFLV